MPISPLTFRITADVSGLNAGLTQVSGRLRGAADQVQQSFRGVTREVDSSVGTATSRISGLTTAVGGLAAVYAVFRGITAFARIADDAALSTARIQGLTGSVEQTREAQSALFELSQRLQTGYGEAVASFSRMLPAVKELGGGVAETTRLTEILLTTAKLSGASAAESAASAMQFAQALGSGVLQGDELRSILENNNTLARTLAEGLGVSIGELRRMGEEGKLTADLVAGTLLDNYDAIQAKAGELPGTVGGAWTEIKNAFVLFVTETENGTGVMAALAQTMSEVARVITIVAQSFRTVQSESDRLGREKGAETFAQNTGRSFAYLADVVVAVIRSIVEMVRSMVSVFAAAGNQLGAVAAAVVSVARGDFNGAAEIMRDAMARGGAAVTQLGTAMGESFARMQIAITGGGETLRQYGDEVERTAQRVQASASRLNPVAGPDAAGSATGALSGISIYRPRAEEDELGGISVYRKKLPEGKESGWPEFLPLQSDVQSALDTLFDMQQTWAQKITGILQGVAQTFTRELVTRPLAEMAMRYIRETALYKLLFGQQIAGQAAASTATTATKAAEATAVVGANAAEAASGAAASQASIPFVGPALAAGAFAVVMAMVLGARSQIKSAAGGYDIPSGLNPVTQLHAEEMVLPAEHANTIREMSRQSAAAGPPIELRGVSAGEFFIAVRKDLVKVLQNAHREFAF